MLDEFLSCDWGTSTFRLRRVTLPATSVVQEIKTNRGIRTFVESSDSNNPTERASRCARYFAEQVEALSLPEGKAVLAVVSGMAASSIGWKELPYAKTPFALDGSTVGADSRIVQTRSGCRITVWLVSGVQTDSEIMRGEETEIIGLFANGRHADVARHGTVVLPGTHSKHVRLREDKLVGFRTFMTGELFDVLASNSVLRASIEVSGAGGAADFLNDQVARDAFVDGVILARDRGLLSSLFQVRTRTVLRQVSPHTNRWFLSGLLIGAELSDRFNEGPGNGVLLAALPPLSELYHLALHTIAPELEVEVVAPEEMRQVSIHGQAVFLKTRGASPHPN